MSQKNKEKAAEALRFYKESWGATWQQMATVLGVSRYSSLSVYASIGNAHLMPDYVAEHILALDGVSPTLDSPLMSGTFMIGYASGAWFVIDKVEFRNCVWCDKVFVPEHPQQMYCTKYRGECGQAARRKRRTGHG